MQSAAQQGLQKNGPQTETLNPDRPSTPISNRYRKLLEPLVTHTKQTTASRSNRYKNRFSPRRFSSPIRPRSCQDAGHSTDRIEQPALNIGPPASNLQPPASRTSNRYSKLLEIRVSHTKQKTAPLSNRYKIAFFQAAAERPFADWSSTQ